MEPETGTTKCTRNLQCLEESLNNKICYQNKFKFTWYSLPHVVLYSNKPILSMKRTVKKNHSLREVVELRHRCLRIPPSLFVIPLSHIFIGSISGSIHKEQRRLQLSLVTHSRAFKFLKAAERSRICETQTWKESLGPKGIPAHRTRVKRVCWAKANKDADTSLAASPLCYLYF